LLAKNEVINWQLSPWVILKDIWLKVNLLAGRIFHKGDFNITHLVSIKVVIGNAPRLRDSPLHNREVFDGPFLYKKEVPT
jgi:hypothetical protein